MVNVGVIESKLVEDTITTGCFRIPTGFFVIDPVIHIPNTMPDQMTLRVSQLQTPFEASKFTKTQWESNGWRTGEDIDEQLKVFANGLSSRLGSDITVLKCHLENHIIAIAYASNFTNHKGGFVLLEDGSRIILETGEGITLE